MFSSFLKKACLRSLGLAGILVVATASAHAGTYTIDYTTVSLDSGELFVTTTDSPVAGPFTVIAISGERDGVAITGLSPYAASDQLLFTASPYFDFSGVSFSTSSGVDYNLFTNTDGLNYEISSQTDSVGYAASGILISSVAVPEPTSLAMISVGFIGLGIAVGRRRATTFA
jgi:hypothetical protein